MTIQTNKRCGIQLKPKAKKVSLREDSTAGSRSKSATADTAYNLAYTCTRIKGNSNMACNTVLEHLEAQQNKRGYEKNK